MGRRTQADRDAITVEIGYAFVSASFVAAVSFGAVYSGALAFSSPAAHRALALAGAIVGATVFTLQAARVLWPFARRQEDDGGSRP
ncbi:DUF6332 family protein [Streptomyces sp. NPDC002044]|uniref:DUF6332 family protein n=1 Tax=Streptomyces sp. NPDC002044 TaxID=3154662 RepID=UPI00331CE00C